MRHSIIILFLFSISQVMQSQQPALNFINFSSNNGLSSNTVNAILKDKLGYMWFASDDGLNKFDGISFTVYNHNALDTNSIGSNRIQSIYEDSRGNLWMGTNRTLSLYDRQKDCFHNYNITNETAIRAICSDNAGHLWIGGYVGLILYDPDTRHAKYYTADSTKPGHLLSNTITCLFRDSRDRLWIGSNTGLYQYQPRTDNFKRFNNVPTDPASISDNVIKAIAEDSSGHLWFGTNMGGLNMLQEDGVHFNHFKNSRTNVNTLSSNTVFNMVTDYTGQLWLGTEEGLNIFDPNTGNVQRVSGDDRNKYSLKGRSIRSIYIDKRGIYWVGTFQDGVNKYDKNLVFFNLVQYNLFDPRGLSSPKITSFAETDNGDMYVGTDGGGLNLYHRKTGLFDHVSIGDINKKPGFAILTMERSGNELWIGTFQHGVYVMDIRNKCIRHYTKGDGPQDLISNEVFCIKRDTHGNIWLGSNGNGICMYDPKLGIFQRMDAIGLEGSANKLLSHGFIRDIEEDADGNILVATVGSGMALYNPVQHTCRLFNRANTNLPLDEVISLHIDRKGSIWAGTPGSGLCLLDYTGKRYADYSEQQGLANAVIYKILEDDAGKLWLSTNKGISCFDPQTSAFKNYASQNGLQQSSFNGGAGKKTASGELFFGGIEGFNYFLPSTLKDNKNVPAIVFTDLKIGGHSIVPGKDAAIKENIAVASSVSLDYKQNFSVDFVALDYTTPRQNRYMYKLDAFDKSWNEIGTSRTAVFANLYPGNYTLQVKAKNCNGAWITMPASIKIYVKPPFWLTGYAYAFYILMTGFLLWGIRYRGIRKMKNKFALEQERLQMKQTIDRERLEAERLHEFDELKIKFLTNLSHEFRTPISLILGPVQQLHEKEADPDKRGQLAMVKRNARRLLNLVNELLDFRKLGERELKLNCTECDIVSFVKEAAESFRDIAERKQIHFTFKTGPGSFFTAFDKDKIERVLFNLLGNAFKFTGNGGKILIEIKQAAAKELMIIISDTGIGIPAYEHQRIFDRFYQGNAHTSVMNQGSGIGLSITKEFVRLHGGTIAVESEPGQGSVFTISLPFENVSGVVNEIVINENAFDSGAIAEDKKATVVPALDMLTVLLVEDNDDFRNYLKDNLKSSYKIIEASDGKEGWQKALSRHPDVIVSDISMPNMDGIELSRKIKSDKRTGHIPIILLTALTGDANQLRGLETGANDYLTKPFNFHILNARIRNLFDLNQSLKNTYTRQLKIVTPVVEVQSEDDKLMLSVSQYIEANLNSPKLSVEELSRHVCMSRGSFYNKIVTLTGETPVEFIRSVKLNKAAGLLESTDMKIAQIGYAVGFTTPNYFARAFKAKFNVLPSEYLQQKRQAAPQPEI